MEKSIKILDCTLRDGGYVNNWNFGKKNITKIISKLLKSNVEYIETGFMTLDDRNENLSLYKTFNDIENILPKNTDTSKLCVMITYSKFNIDNIPDVNHSPIKNIRLIFKKRDMQAALDFAHKIKEKGYGLFINPTYIDQYNNNEIIKLLKIINEIKPKVCSIVDSLGIIQEKEILKIYNIFNENLDKDIMICYHSHNNLALSFSNTIAMIKQLTSRELIIDSAIFGMGRGAGNLKTEAILRYLNENYSKNYNLIPILKILDEIINPIFNKTPWGYSIPYYLAGINKCHPFYAKFLIDKKTVKMDMINKILSSIPVQKRADFDKNLINKKYEDMIKTCPF